MELLLLDQAQFFAVMSAAPPEDYRDVRRAILRFTLIRGIKYAAREELRRQAVATDGGGSPTRRRKKRPGKFFYKYDEVDVSEAERDKILAVRDDLNAPEGEGRELTHMREEMRDLRQLVFTIAEHLRVPAASEPESPLAALPRPD